MTTDGREQQLPIDTIEVSFDIEVEHPVVSPAALTGLAHSIDCRFAGSIAVGVGVKHRLQNRLQVPTDDHLGNAGHLLSEYRPAAPAEESSSLRTGEKAPAARA